MIQRVNSTSFEGRKFMVPVKIIDIPNTKHLPGDWRRVYNNPEAKSLYKQASKEKCTLRKIELLENMGHYDVINWNHQSLWQKIMFTIETIF